MTFRVWESNAKISAMIKAIEALRSFRNWAGVGSHDRYRCRNVFFWTLSLVAGVELMGALEECLLWSWLCIELFSASLSCGIKKRGKNRRSKRIKVSQCFTFMCWKFKLRTNERIGIGWLGATLPLISFNKRRSHTKHEARVKIKAKECLDY